VNKIPFLKTISRNIDWHTIAPVPNRKKTTILRELNYLITIYKTEVYTALSDDLSPETIMTGYPDYRKLKIEFGSYVQFFDAPNPSKTPRTHNHSNIALGETGNTGGAFYFLSLASGEIFSC